MVSIGGQYIMKNTLVPQFKKQPMVKDFKEQPMVKSEKNSPVVKDFKKSAFELLNNDGAKEAAKLRTASKSSAAAPIAGGKFGKFIGQ